MLAALLPVRGCLLGLAAGAALVRALLLGAVARVLLRALLRNQVAHEAAPPVRLPVVLRLLVAPCEQQRGAPGPWLPLDTAAVVQCARDRGERSAGAACCGVALRKVKRLKALD